jgi:hypothetical protein
MISCCVAFFASPKSNSQNQSRPVVRKYSIRSANSLKTVDVGLDKA